MAKENENLESTEETVEEVVADKDAEQEHLDRQKEEEESIALASEKAKEKAKKTLLIIEQIEIQNTVLIKIRKQKDPELF